MPWLFVCYTFFYCFLKIFVVYARASIFRASFSSLLHSFVPLTGFWSSFVFQRKFIVQQCHNYLSVICLFFAIFWKGQKTGFAGPSKYKSWDVKHHFDCLHMFNDRNDSNKYRIVESISTNRKRLIMIVFSLLSKSPIKIARAPIQSVSVEYAANILVCFQEKSWLIDLSTNCIFLHLVYGIVYFYCV